MSIDPEPTPSIFLRELSIQHVGYLGASVLDQSSAKAMATALHMSVLGMPGGALREQLLADLQSQKLKEEIYANAPLAPPADEATGTYVISGRGVCMEPAVMDGDDLEIDPAATVRPGDMVALVSKFSLFPKIAMYLGQHTGDGILSTFGSNQPAFAHVFLQRDPLSILAVAEDDLLAIHRVVATIGTRGRHELGRWPFDVRAHPSLDGFWKDTALEAIPPRDSRPVIAVQHETFRAMFDRMDELLAGAT